MSDESDRKKTRLFVNPKFQLPILGLVCGIAVVSVVLFGTLMFVETKLLLKFAQQAGELQAVKSLLWEYALFTGIIFVLALGIFILWALLISHRIAGPITRIKQELSEMEEHGDIHLLKVRENDYLRSLFEVLNRVLIDLKEQY